MLNIIILAAGKGTRMRSSLPKVLQPIAGKPMLGHVIETSQSLSPDKIIVVVGHEADQVKSYVNERYSDITFVDQTEQLGTGHAVKLATAELDSNDNANTIVLYGDTPLLTDDQLAQLNQQISANTLALLTTQLADPSGYGRVLLSTAGHNKIERVIEHKDATEAEKTISLINTGVIGGKAKHFIDWLPMVKNDNAQGEYYLPDIIPLARQHDADVVSVESNDATSTFGVNDKIQLAGLERIYQERQAIELMRQGVTLIDPKRIDVRGTLSVGQDVSIDANVVIIGDVTLSDNVRIESNCVLQDCEIGANSTVHAFSSIDGARIADHCQVGPYARLRPEALLASGSKVGNFVEMKKSSLGKGSKANHFTYLGDTTVGEHVNIGAGTITCNYDGVNKHQTIIGDNAFIGSNSSLVAPIQIGEGATIGAGSILSGQISGEGLTLTRSAKKHLANWSRPTKKSTS